MKKTLIALVASTVLAAFAFAAEAQQAEKADCKKDCDKACCKKECSDAKKEQCTKDGAKGQCPMADKKEHCEKDASTCKKEEQKK